MDSNDVENNALLLTPEVGVEHVERAVMLWQAFAQRFRDVDRLFRKQLLAYVEEHGEVTVGDVKYWAGYPKRTKNDDVKATLRELLETVDVDTLADCLSSDAFKPGACKRALSAEAFDRLFTTTAPAKLESKQLQSGDVRFIEGRRTDTTTPNT